MMMTTPKALRLLPKSAMRCGALALSATLMAFAAPLQAADKSCAAVNRAGEAGLANARIHQAFLTPPEKGPKVPVTAETTVNHFIVIDKTAYSSAIKGKFSTEAVATLAERSSYTYYLANLTDMEDACRSLGTTTLGGRKAIMFEQGSNKKLEDTLIKVWIDSATGLPLRADFDAGRVEVTRTKDEKGLPVTSAKKGNTRGRDSVVFLFGAAVKPPVFGGKAGAFDDLLVKSATIEPQTTTALAALLN